ncbi:hypothetical protein [Niallia sp. FSL M8-0099]|jgi:replication initiation and membrane attachment protein DnaB|uniref:hypothetical protein n=1 Tax=Niallia sp. FSL M8-0099 TaxID=2954519 RepID=UPI00164237EF
MRQKKQTNQRAPIRKEIVPDWIGKNNAPEEKTLEVAEFLKRKRELEERIKAL